MQTHKSKHVRTASALEPTADLVRRDSVAGGIGTRLDGWERQDIGSEVRP
jgi:hypothetical protein